MRTLDQVGIALLLAAAWPASAGPVQVRSQHERRPIEGSEAYYWLLPQQMMVLEVRGPTHLGLRLRQVQESGRSSLPVDLTVVRDDIEQGTVRFRVPQVDGELSGEVLVRVDVPAGAHTYRLLVSGPTLGVVLSPFSGAIEVDEQAILATPGGDRAILPPKPGPRRRPSTRPVPKAEPPEELAAVSTSARRTDPPRTFLIEHRPDEDGGLRFQPGTWAAGSLAGMFLLGGTALAISSGVLAGRAEDEPVQVKAGVYFDRAERSGQAAAILFGLAGAALLTAIVVEVTAQPAPAQAPDGGGLALIRW